MAYPLLGFPAEDVPCRTEPMSDQRLQHASCGTRLYRQLSFCTRRTVGSLAGFKLVTWVLPMSGDFTVSWPRHMPQHCAGRMRSHLAAWMQVLSQALHWMRGRKPSTAAM